MNVENFFIMNSKGRGLTNRFKHIKLLANRKIKVGKLPSKFIEEKKQLDLKTQTNTQETLTGNLEIFKFNQKESQILTFKTIQDFQNEIKQINQEYNYLINIDTNSPVKIAEILKNIIPNFDDLIIEDILNTDQRIKTEKRNELNFIIIKVPTKENINEIFSPSIPKVYEQFSIIYYKNIIVIFQEGIEGDHLQHIRTNLEQLRQNNTEFFIYYIIDLTVDKYLAFLEDIENYLIEIEKKIFEQEKIDLKILYFCRVNLGIIKRDFLNLLETVNKLKLFFFTPSLKYYIQDLLDHIYKTIEFVDNLNSFLSYLLEIHFSFLNAKLNEGLKILTIINTVFVPAIFIASIYGMNFENMPELKWKYGYFFTLFLIFSTIVFSLIYIKKKNL